MDLSKLRIFLEAARLQNYTVAGRRVHLSQSAVSHAIRKLEVSLGHKLIDWKGRRFHLTPEGTYLLQVCERVFRELDTAERHLAGGAAPSLRIVLGVTVEFGTTVLVPRLAPMLEKAPGLHVDFIFSNHLSQPLQQGEIDLAVDCKPHYAQGLVRTPLFREKYVLMAAPAYLARHPVQTPADLSAVTLLSLDEETQWWRNLYDALPRGDRPSPGRVLVVSHVRGIVNAALAGLGVGLAPKYTVLEELASGRLVDVLPALNLVEDEFAIYQLGAVAGREANLLLVQMLQRLPFSDFGDALARA
jgi:DNA-binding transcriptional LysR family regulator